MRGANTKHSPRVDEHETGSPRRAEGERGPASRTKAAGEPDAVTQGSGISRHVRLSAFPADREALIREAEANRAPEHVLEHLRRLPHDIRFGTVNEVRVALDCSVDTVAGRPIRTCADRRSR
jgi:hypothetical protein